MKRYIIWIAAMIMGGISTVCAQTNDHTITVTSENGEREQIDVPESMTQQLDSLMEQYNAKLYLRPDSDCNLPDINPTYDKQTIMARLAQLPTVSNCPTTPSCRASSTATPVRYAIRWPTCWEPRTSTCPSSRSPGGLRLPLELKYLPVIESGLNPKAVSKAGATGLWQFMLKTAKRYGLEVNSLVDDRRDIVKSSYAAAHYLSDLYKLYNDWALVIAAYNCGPDVINKAIHRSKGETDYWKIYPRLPRETRAMCRPSSPPTM
jgi:membrane-bound lytic murein transglycosylase D